MFVETVTTDAPQGATEVPWEPGWDAGTLAALVDQLDGVDRTALVLQGPGQAHLALGGSTTAGLVLYVSDDAGTHALAAGAEGRGRRTVVAGGTVVAYELRFVLEAPVAVRAAWHWASTGQLDPGLRWEESG